MTIRGLQIISCALLKVRSVSMQKKKGTLMFIKNHLDYSAVIHARHTELERPVCYEGNSFRVNAAIFKEVREEVVCGYGHRVVKGRV